MNSADHPSRQAPKCADCRHSLLAIHNDIRCNHPAAPVNPATGIPVLFAVNVRNGANGSVDRYKAMHDLCGPAGLAFEPDTEALIVGAPVIGPTAIGQPWPEQGGVYAGVARGVDGAPDYHLILSIAKPDTELGWQAAQDWAKALTAQDQTDWVIPTRAESALLFANLREMFEPRWHWTSEQYSRSSAWYQYFVGGAQAGNGKSYAGRARAVRRLVIQSFSHS